MLVLLIIFMVITPMLTKGVSVEMVKTKNPIAMKDADKEDAVLIAITRDGRVLAQSGQREDQVRDHRRQGEGSADEQAGQDCLHQGRRARQVRAGGRRHRQSARGGCRSDRADHRADSGHDAPQRSRRTSPTNQSGKEIKENLLWQ